MPAEIVDGEDWREHVNWAPGGAPTAAPGEEFRFETVAELALKFPDLEAFARQLDPARLVEGAAPAGYAVRVYPGGTGRFGAFESAVVALRGQFPDGRLGYCETTRLVLRRGEATTWADMADMADGSSRPPFSVAAAELAAEAAVDHAKRAAVVLGKLSALVARQPTLQPVVSQLMGGLADAYRAGRFMREAELAQRFELAVVKGELAHDTVRKGAAAANAMRAKATIERRAEVRRLADGLLDQSPPKAAKHWSRDALSGEIHDTWKQEGAPAARTIARDLKALGFAKGVLRPADTKVAEA